MTVFRYSQQISGNAQIQGAGNIRGEGQPHSAAAERIGSLQTEEGTLHGFIKIQIPCVVLRGFQQREGAGQGDRFRSLRKAAVMSVKRCSETFADLIGRRQFW